MKYFLRLIIGAIVMVGCFTMGKYFSDMNVIYQCAMWFLCWFLLDFREHLNK